MTIKQVSQQLYNLSVAGYFNGEKFTRRQLENALAAWVRKDGENFILQIALLDGWWWMMVDRVNGEYSYYIPDTREQEHRLYEMLMAKSKRA